MNHPPLAPTPPEAELGVFLALSSCGLAPNFAIRSIPPVWATQPKPGEPGRLRLAGKQLHSSNCFEANCARQQPCAAAVRTPSAPCRNRECKPPERATHHSDTHAQVELVAPPHRANTSIAKAERAIHVRRLHARPWFISGQGRECAWLLGADGGRWRWRRGSWQMGPMAPRQQPPALVGWGPRSLWVRCWLCLALQQIHKHQQAPNSVQNIKW